MKKHLDIQQSTRIGTSSTIFFASRKMDSSKNLSLSKTNSYLTIMIHKAMNLKIAKTQIERVLTKMIILKKISTLEMSMGMKMTRTTMESSNVGKSIIRTVTVISMKKKLQGGIIRDIGNPHQVGLTDFSEK